MEATVCVSNSLLETMTLAAIEAYVLGDGRKKTQIETLGYLWGTKKIENGHVYYHADKVSISLSAQRGSGWVQPNQKAIELKNSIFMQWSPYVYFLGDFHTHPYKNLKEVKQARGYDFSEGDFKYFLEDNYAWEQSQGNPIWLVVAICKISRVREQMFIKFQDREKSNARFFSIGEYRIWINACNGYLLKKEKRTINKNVFIDFMNFEHYNPQGNRLRG